MRFLSICSGIEAASVAWKPLGWTPVAFSEIEKFPSAVLAHHYPEVPNLGDMTQFESWPEKVFAEADIIVGGTPCQAWSVAGLRQGLEDPRGNLTLVFVQLVNHADAIRRKYGKPPIIIVWENVPGVLSSKDNGFGSFLGGLAGEGEALVPPGKKWTDAGCVFGPERSLAWRVLDAQHFGLAQRRRRVFVVASAGDVSASEILFERQGVRGDSEAGIRQGQDAPDSATGGTRRTTASHWDDPRNPHPTLSQSHNTGGLGGSNQELFSQRGAGLVWGGYRDATPKFAEEIMTTLRVGGDGGDNHFVGGMLPAPASIASAYPIQEVGKRTGTSTTDTRCGIGIGADGDPMYTLQASAQHGIAFALRGREEGAVPEIHGNGDTVGALRAANGGSSRDYIAFGGNNTSGPINVATARNACSSPSGRLDFETETFLVEPASLGVRRITPTESERLQGFPDLYTRISWGGKPAEGCPDGHRQKAIGNSMATPCMAFIGRRIKGQITTT